MLLNVIQYHFIVLNTNIVHMLENIDPMAPTGRLNVTISKESMDKAKELSKKENRSLSNMIDTMIKQYRDE
jgi:hypothetical protein